MGLIIIPGQDEPEPQPGHDLVRITPGEIRAWVAEAIARNKDVVRTARSQEALDRCVEVLHEEGETHLAAGLLYLSAARVGGYEGPALEALIQVVVDLKLMGAMEQSCRVCGCTNQHACPGGCSWVEMDLCSACDRRLKAAARDAYRDSTLPGPGRDD